MAEKSWDEQVANRLVSGLALAFRRLENGSMIVIAPNGMKLIYGPAKVKVTEEQLRSESEKDQE